DDYEADDIMGALATQASKKNIETLLITSDLDMLQLINDKVHVYALKTGLSNIELYSPKSFEAKYGLSVDQFLDFKAIKGDSSDNIPGVPGIGEKGAIDLLKQFKTLDGVYDNLDLVKESIKNKLINGKKEAYLSRELAKIWVDAPLKLDLKEVDGSKIQPKKILDLLQKFEFRSLARNLPEVFQDAITQANGDNYHPVLNNLKKEFIDSDEKLNLIDIKDEVYIHSFIHGKNGQEPGIIALADENNKSFVIDCKKIDKAKLGAKFKEIFTDRTKLIGFDVKSTLKIFLNLGLDMPSVGHDIQMAAFLINPLTGHQTISDVAYSEFNKEGPAIDNLDPDSLKSAMPEILQLIKNIYKKQIKKFDDFPKIKKLATEIEWPLIPVLAIMEFIGIELDTKYLNKFSKEIDKLIYEYEQKIYKHAKSEFNISSPSQLAEILFTNLKLNTTGIKKGKTGYSTAASELDKLRGIHPIIDLITQFREVTKLKNTYVDTLPKLVDQNSRLHTTFSLTVAQTGRLSSSDPNLQNIPIRTDLGKRIRTAFVAGKGNKLVSADYSQFELRLAAVLANDKELISMFNRGADIHASTAAQVYGRSQEDVTKQMRRAAKIINFGILYGMSPHGLSVATGMNREQAVDFINKYKELRKPIFDYIDKVIENARKDGFVETMFGRRRPTPDIHSSNFVVRQAAERAAINMPAQGTEADLMKMAMININNYLTSQHNDCNMLLQIHDSILVECPGEVSEKIGEQLKQIMESVYELPVRLEVDVTIGDNWGQL
ncbi:MAG TPA: DNA polymerase I, partial [Patescibacteria group bacterium]|nr:DNA polymerase I [Patescibacteria group bacterium]